MQQHQRRFVKLHVRNNISACWNAIFFPPLAFFLQLFFCIPICVLTYIFELHEVLQCPHGLFFWQSRSAASVQIDCNIKPVNWLNVTNALLQERIFHRGHTSNWNGRVDIAHFSFAFINSEYFKMHLLQKINTRIFHDNNLPKEMAFFSAVFFHWK